MCAFPVAEHQIPWAKDIFFVHDIEVDIRRVQNNFKLHGMHSNAQSNNLRSVIAGQWVPGNVPFVLSGDQQAGVQTAVGG